MKHVTQIFLEVESLTLSKGFYEKCKHTELVLNFNQKQFLVKKTHFPFILMEYRHRELAKSCF